MKLNIIKQILIITFIIISINKISSLKKFGGVKKTGSISEVDSFFNRGFSFLNINREINQFPETPLSPKGIFKHETNVQKNILPNFLYSNEYFRYVINRNISLINPEEILKNERITVQGDYTPIVNTGFYKKGISHIFRRGVSNQITVDNFGYRLLVPDHDRNFPNLSDEFLKDSFTKFFKLPNSVQLNGTFSDFMNDDNLIQGTLDFFKDYGTHYISEYTLGFRNGFYREYRTKKTFMENVKANIPNTNLDVMVLFVQKTEKIKISKDIKKNPEPVPFVPYKKENSLSNSEDSFDPNDPDKFLDDDAIFSSSLTKFDSNSILKDNLTTLGKNLYKNNSTKYDYIVNEIPKLSANTTPLFSSFAVGDCELENFFMKSNKCNLSNARLIKYKISPIYNLFNPLYQNKKIMKFGNQRVHQGQMRMIYNTLRKLFSFIQEALDPNLFVVTNIFSEKYDRSNVDSMHPCFKKNATTLETIRNKYKLVNRKYLFNEETILMNKDLPVISIINYATNKKSYDIISNAQDSLYWCINREHNIHPEDLVSGKWRQRKYLIDIKYIIENDNIPFTNAGYDCKETWAFNDIKTKDLNRFHFCVKYTNDFMNPMIITDVKIFSFQKSMLKCISKSFFIWNDGKKYICDCEINLQKYSDEVGQNDKDIFFCYSRKNELFYESVSPNKPINSQSKFAPKKK